MISVCRIALATSGLLISLSKEIDKFHEIFLDLKAEITKLNHDIDRKIYILVKIHLKELKDLRKEEKTKKMVEQIIKKIMT